jgi:hypothetical protein
MAVVIHRDARGIYHVLPVEGDWVFSVGVFQEAAGVDITGDGRPEIRVDFYTHSGSMNFKDMAFYQWQGKNIETGKFVLILGYDNIQTDVPFNDIQISGPDGAPKTLKFVSTGIGRFNYTTTWKWNGSGFDESSRFPVPADQSFARGYGVYQMMLENGQFRDVTDKIKALPPDPWRLFILGYAEALQFHPVPARSAFQAVLAQSQDSQGDLKLLPAAQAFLDAYKEDTDLYRACQAALLVEAKAPCVVSPIFARYLEHFKAQPVPNILEPLEGYGFKFGVKLSEDFNMDGQADWILQEGTDLWLLASRPGGFDYQKISSYWEYNQAPAQLSDFTLLADENNPAAKVFVLKQLQHVIWFQLHREGGYWDYHELLSDYGNSDYTATQVEGKSTILLFHQLNRYSQLPEIAIWDAASQSFQKMDYLEWLLLEHPDPWQALRVIPSLLEKIQALPDDQIFMKTYIPRLNYLLGLAYELNNDPENAARVYYDLWKASPLPVKEYEWHYDQPYVLMARDKLKLIKP